MRKTKAKRGSLSARHRLWAGCYAAALGIRYALFMVLWAGSYAAAWWPIMNGIQGIEIDFIGTNPAARSSNIAGITWIFSSQP